MKREKVLNMRVFAVVAAFVLLVVSVVCYGSFDSSAGTSTRAYLRYDSQNPNAKPHHYSITVFDSVYSSGIETYGIIGSNDMERDSNTSVVSLNMEDMSGYEVGTGSGFIVGDHVMLTAAHCVYDIDKGEFRNTTANIVNDENEIIKELKAHYIHVPKKFADAENVYSNDSCIYDYALLYFDEDLSEYGAFNLGICLDKYIRNKGEVIVSGFPTKEKYPDEYLGNNYGLRFKAKGKITDYELSGNVIRYDADAAPGDSGGPVYVNESYINDKIKYDYNTVIAIVTRSGYKSNAGVRINYDILYFCYQNVNLTA